MRIKALVTMLVLGSSSIALAQPVVRDHRDHTTHSHTTSTGTIQLSAGLRAHASLYTPPPVYVAPAPVYVAPTPPPTVGPAPIAQPVAQPAYIRPMPVRPILLANDVTISGRALIKVPAMRRSFSKLELRADNGRANIDKVMIVFGNGQQQVVNLDAKLSKRNSSIQIDLAGNTRYIEKIVLVGKTNGRGAAVDVIAL